MGDVLSTLGFAALCYYVLVTISGKFAAEPWACITWRFGRRHRETVHSKYHQHCKYDTCQWLKLILHILTWFLTWFMSLPPSKTSQHEKRNLGQEKIKDHTTPPPSLVFFKEYIDNVLIRYLYIFLPISYTGSLWSMAYVNRMVR